MEQFTYRFFFKSTKRHMKPISPGIYILYSSLCEKLDSSYLGKLLWQRQHKQHTGVGGQSKTKYRSRKPHE